MNKKGLSYFDNWPEIYFLILLVIGLIVAVASPSAFFLYLTILIIGLAAGRVWSQRRGMMHVPHMIIIAGFLIGFFLGSFRGSRLLMIILFIIGSIVSYQLHVKGIVR